MKKIEHIYDGYVDRVSRYEFVLKNFAALFQEADSILDVGCDDNHLKGQFGSKVFGVDITGTPDRQTDLEKESLSFLGNNTYDLSLCTEVLEHIDNLHQVLDDLVRVSQKAVLISLPNCTSSQRLYRILKGNNTGKFYGLPLERPVDRHKWFFSYPEIIAFFTKYAEKNNLNVERIVLSYSVVYPQESRGLHRIWQQGKKFVIAACGLHNMSKSVFVVLRKK